MTGSDIRKTAFSAMRPTGRLHLGHLVGALQSWVSMQERYDCIFAVVDWHAYMSEYARSRGIRESVEEMTIDWIACGIDPDRSLLFLQSDVPEHLELFMMLSCITPLGWLERNPTYKEQLRELSTRDLQTYGFLGYPVLQTADILLYKAEVVPIGEDQLPHLELAREIARRFNHIYGGAWFPDCAPVLTPTPRLLGLDGRKMSKSYGNTIALADPPDEVRAKVRTMFTDPQRVRLSDPGHPDVCNVFHYYETFASDRAAEVRAWCSQARRGCTECKACLAEVLCERLAPIREKRAALAADRKRVREVLRRGGERARERARRTMVEIRKVVFGDGL